MTDTATARTDSGPETARDKSGDTFVPSGETAYECPHCGDPFRREQYRTLHLGLAHYDRLDDAEREAFEDAYEAEEADIARYRLRILGGLVLLYFGLLFTYSIVT